MIRFTSSRIYLCALALATLLASLGFAAPARGAEEPVKVAVIVGPVGEELTPVYLSLAEAAALAAEQRGARVARAYSPGATGDAVLDAVENASIVVYLGHGVGSPNPYSDTPDPTTTNGWGLNGPNARGDHADSWQDGTLAYYGETWIAEHARPAPGWVMIYSNACYAPGAGEGFDEPATEEMAAGRVSAYSRGPLADLGASAYFATDYFEGAAHLVGMLLDQPALPYGDLFATEPRFTADGLVRLPHASLEGAETWLHRSAYFDGKTDYWYAFAGIPSASFGAAGISLLPAAWQPGTAFANSGLGSVLAVPYAESPGFEGQATAALSAELRARMPEGATAVEVCAERCAELRVVDGLPRQAPSASAGGEAAMAISQHGWALVTDRSLDGQPLLVRLRLHPAPALASAEPSDVADATPGPVSAPAASALPARPPPPPPATPAPPATSPTPSPGTPAPAPTEPASPTPSATPIPSPAPAAPPPTLTPPSPTPSASPSATATPSASAAASP